MIILAKNRLQPDETGTVNEPDTRDNAMTSPMQASLSAIGQRLRAEYFPAVGRPLPPELEDLLAQIVAREAAAHGSIERSAEVLQPALAQLRGQS